MSYKVTEEVLDRSCARHGARNLLLALAEVAHFDGVGHLRQGKDTEPADRRTLRHRMAATDRTVRRAIVTCEAIDELEVVAARRKRSTIYIYRIIVGRLRDLEVDYDRHEECLPPLIVPRCFWTPEELAMPRDERPLRGHVVRQSTEVQADILSAGQESDGRTSSTVTGGHFDRDEEAILSASETAGSLTRTREGVPSLDQPTGPSRTSLSSKSEEREVPPPLRGAARTRHSRKEQTDGLIRAFAETVGAWPDGRGGWGAWSKAFGSLVDAGVTPGEVRKHTAEALRRWPDYNLEPFALTKLWQVVSASLEQGYLAMHRWVHDLSWRLPADDVEWILASSPRIDDSERRQLRDRAAELREQHCTPDTNFLRWVEERGWHVDDDEWRREFQHLRGQLEPDVLEQGQRRRAQIRGALAELDFGVKREQAA